MNADPADTDIVRVVFRVWKDSGDIIALFPDLPFDYAGLLVTSYMHIGQHGGADYQHVMSVTRPAFPREYEPLKRELEGRPYEYRLKVMSRRAHRR